MYDVIEDAKLPTELQQVNLSGIDFLKRDLSRHNLTGANLSGCVDWRHPVQHRAHGQVARLLEYALRDLSRHNLTGSNMSNANLSGCNLSSSVLTGANLTGANLTSASFRFRRNRWRARMHTVAGSRSQRRRATCASARPTLSPALWSTSLAPERVRHRRAMPGPEE